MKKGCGRNAGAFFKDDTDTVWLSRRDCRNYFSFRPDSDRDILFIPQVELINAMKKVLAEHPSIDEDTLRFEAAGKFFFPDKNYNVEPSFVAALEVMKDSGQVDSTDGKIRLKNDPGAI